jgi:hypothetical protein
MAIFGTRDRASGRGGSFPIGTKRPVNWLVENPSNEMRLNAPTDAAQISVRNEFGDDGRGGSGAVCRNRDDSETAARH